MSSGYSNNSIFWVETTKISPNPYQPRKEFDPKALEDLADSIRQYGVLQPLVVTRHEVSKENGGMDVRYELIAGERRLRASQLAKLQQVPVIIRKETNSKVKLELAIIENIQREDLNAIDRALAFQQLHREFNLTHAEIGKKMGKSRVYVSNSMRLLSLPAEIQQGLIEKRINEGHTRPLLMLSDRPEEQATLYQEIMVKKMSVRDAEKVARKIAQDRVRKKEFYIDPKIRDYEQKLSENLGTRVHIEPKEQGGKITIDYFTTDDLETILASMKKIDQERSMMEQFLEKKSQAEQSQHKDLSESTPVVAAPGLPEYHKSENSDIEIYKPEIEPVSSQTFPQAAETNQTAAIIETEPADTFEPISFAEYQKRKHGQTQVNTAASVEKDVQQSETTTASNIESVQSPHVDPYHEPIDDEDLKFNELNSTSDFRMRRNYDNDDLPHDYPAQPEFQKSQSDDINIQQ